MENRIYLNNLHDQTEKEVTVMGWVDTRRDHGKLIFIDLRDRTGKIQMVALPNHSDAHALAEKLRPEWVIAVTGKINIRPEKMINKAEANGDIEIEITNINILSEAKELPFEKDTELNLDTYLDNLPLTLRSERARRIFLVQASIIQTFRESLTKDGFIEYQNPILVGGDGEGGAAAFRVDYYNEKKALLATSPQLYKQILVGVFERVFTTTKVFRAEKHATTRHLSEVVQMDFEMGFIDDHRSVMDVLENTIKKIVQKITEEHKETLDYFKIETPLIPTNFPVLKLREAQKILKETHGINCEKEPDLEPEHERLISLWAKEKHQSDFIFITHFPNGKRSFYTYQDADDEGYSKSFVLLFRGLEINSGSHRVHNYDELVERIKKRGLDPNIFVFYLQAFKYGMPPHGGCSTGLERFTAKLLGLANVKEASLFPRDINRIDTLLSS